VLIAGGATVGWVRSDALVILLLAGMALGSAGTMATGFAFVQEVSHKHVGLTMGLLGGIALLFVSGFLPFAGWVSDRAGGFAPVFVLVGLLPIVGLTALWLGWGWATEEQYGAEKSPISN